MVDGGLPDCEVVAVAWPDSAQLTVGTWLEPGGDPAAAAGPARAATPRRTENRAVGQEGAQAPGPPVHAGSRLGRPPMSAAAGAALAAACFRPIMGLISDRPFAREPM